MGTARLLTSNDLSQFENLIDRKFHAKELKSEDSNQKFIDALHRSGDGQTRIYGYFNNENELTSAACQFLWGKLPFYTMTWGLIHPKYMTSVFNRSVSEAGARECFDSAIRYAESINRFQFFYGMTLRNFKVRRETWLSVDSHLSTHYDISIETVIKAGTVPDYDPWKQIIGWQPRQQDIVIRACRLKNKFIYDQLHKSSLIDVPYEKIYGESL